MDWAALDALTDEEVEVAAVSDADAQPMKEQQLERARRVGLAGSLRFKLKLSHGEFCRRYHVPPETLRAWERGTVKPDAVALAYLRLIEAEPETVARLMAKREPAAAERQRDAEGWSKRLARSDTIAIGKSKTERRLTCLDAGGGRRGSGAPSATLTPAVT